MKLDPVVELVRWQAGQFDETGDEFRALAYLLESQRGPAQTWPWVKRWMFHLQLSRMRHRMEALERQLNRARKLARWIALLTPSRGPS